MSPIRTNPTISITIVILALSLVKANIQFGSLDYIEHEPKVQIIPQNSLAANQGSTKLSAGPNQPETQIATKPVETAVGPASNQVLNSYEAQFPSLSPSSSAKSLSSTNSWTKARDPAASLSGDEFPALAGLRPVSVPNSPNRANSWKDTSASPKSPQKFSTKGKLTRQQMAEFFPAPVKRSLSEPENIHSSYNSPTELGTSSQCMSDYDFDIITLAISWIPRHSEYKICGDGGCGGFSIHGLWPTRTSGEAGPYFCCHSNELKPQSIGHLFTKLDFRWSSRSNDYPSNFGFWRHEWRKHGTCLRNVPSLNQPHSYFVWSMQQFDKLSPQRMLKAVGIYPSKTKVYSSLLIRSTIQAKTNKRVKLSCKTDQNGNVYLEEIRVCFDKKTLRYTNCEADSCPQYIYLPN